MNKQASTNPKGGMEYWKKIVILFCLGWTVIWIYRTVLNPRITSYNVCYTKLLRVNGIKNILSNSRESRLWR